MKLRDNKPITGTLDKLYQNLKQTAISREDKINKTSFILLGDVLKTTQTQQITNGFEDIGQQARKDSNP